MTNRSRHHQPHWQVVTVYVRTLVQPAVSITDVDAEWFGCTLEDLAGASFNGPKPVAGKRRLSVYLRWVYALELKQHRH